MRVKTDEVLNIPADEVQRIESESSPAFSLDPFPVDQKGRKVLPDEIFHEHLKELPNDTRSESGLVAYNGGLLRKFIPGDDSQKDIQRAGGYALQAELKQRRTFAESFEIILRQKARPETIAELNLADNATNQDAIVAAAVIQALTGNMKAQQFVRDTVGEMPTIKQEVTADILTAEDRELLQKIRNRQQADKRKTDQKRPEETETE